MRTADDPDNRDDAPATTATAGPPCHDARDLTAGGALAHIALNGQVYALRITKASKLILTK